jgi:hypothetical protein
LNLQGDFRLITPAGLIQILCQEQRTVRIEAQRGPEQARIDIVAGELAAAELGEFSPTEAMCRLFIWDTGHFSVALLDPPLEPEYIGSWEELMLEAARRHDELLEGLPALAEAD